MSKKVKTDEDFESDDVLIGDFEDIDEVLSVSHFDARRRLEQIKGDKELDRLINGNKYDDLF